MPIPAALPGFGQRSFTMKNCKLCRFSKSCNDLPYICIIAQFAAIAVVLGVLAYLFITQEFHP